MHEILEAADEPVQHPAVALVELDLRPDFEPRPAAGFETAAELQSERVRFGPLANRDAAALLDVEIVCADGVNRQLLRTRVEDVGALAGQRVSAPARAGLIDGNLPERLPRAEFRGLRASLARAQHDQDQHTRL